MHSIVSLQPRSMRWWHWSRAFLTSSAAVYTLLTIRWGVQELQTFQNNVIERMLSLLSRMQKGNWILQVWYGLNYTSQWLCFYKIEGGKMGSLRRRDNSYKCLAHKWCMIVILSTPLTTQKTPLKFSVCPVYCALSKGFVKGVGVLPRVDYFNESPILQNVSLLTHQAQLSGHFILV